jgi:hypothetical protein
MKVFSLTAGKKKQKTQGGQRVLNLNIMSDFLFRFQMNHSQII